MAINFDAFFETLKEGVVDIAKTEATDFLKQATDDGQEFLDQSKLSSKDGQICLQREN